MLFRRSKPKVFCIGLNKTGTTTLEVVLKDIGYKMGDQPTAELLFEDWNLRNFAPIIKYCQTADAFQDMPFSLPYTFMALDRAFKGAKFILTIRDSAEQWYDSLVKFHSKLWSDGNAIPTIEELRNASYRYKGFAYEVNRGLFQTPESDPYHKETLIGYYNTHNDMVLDYFKSRPEKLVVINVSKSSDYTKLCQFLDRPVLKSEFPWENKT